MDSVTLRPAEADDVEAVARLFARSRAVAMPYLPILHSADEDIVFFGRYFDSGLMTLAEQSGALVGFLAETPGWVEQLYLEPDRRGQGIGSMLMEAAKRQQNRLQLWCFVDNLSGRDFYDRHGFVEVRRTDGDNEERLPDILFSWQRPA